MTRGLLIGIIVVAITPSLDAATITYEQPFALIRTLSYPAITGESFPYPRMLDSGVFDWEIPVLDPALGTADRLVLEMDANSTVAADVSVGDVRIVTQIVDPGAGQLLGVEGPVAISWDYDPAVWTPSVWRLGYYGLDSFALYESAAEGTFHIDFSGVARATYTYTPVEIAAPVHVPEPTSVLLLMTGLGIGIRRRITTASL